MEFETKVKVDTTRQEKVFTASQVMTAMREVMTVLPSEIEKSGKDKGSPNNPMTSFLVLMICVMVSGSLEKKLGIDGADGPYLDKKQ